MNSWPWQLRRPIENDKCLLLAESILDTGRKITQSVQEASSFCGLILVDRGVHVGIRCSRYFQSMIDLLPSQDE